MNAILSKKGVGNVLSFVSWLKGKSRNRIVVFSFYLRLTFKRIFLQKALNHRVDAGFHKIGSIN
jgi:hypothetical protein